MRKKYISALVMFVSVTIILAPGCAKKASDKNGSETGGETRVKVYPVKTVSVSLGDITEYIETTGTIEANTTVKVSAKLPGKIARINYDEGDRVEKGAILFTLETDELMAQKSQALAGLEAAQAALTGAQAMREAADANIATIDANIANLQKNMGRMESLFDEGVGTQKSVDDLNTAYDVALSQKKAAIAAKSQADAGISQANAAISQAEATIKLLDTQLANSVVHAPISGDVASRLFEVGETIAPVMPVLILMDTETLKVKVSAPEADYARISHGSNIQLSANSYPDEIFKGEVTVINPAVNPMDRQFTVEVMISNEDGRLRPGMFANVRILTGIAENVIVVPETAVLQRSGRFVAFVIENDQAAQREIELGIISDRMIQITSGIKIGEHLVFEGNYELQLGIDVEETFSEAK